MCVRGRRNPIKLNTEPRNCIWYSNVYLIFLVFLLGGDESFESFDPF